MPRPGLSFVVPVYNEALVLEPTLDVLVPYLEALGVSFEVLLIDDGSSDESAEILRRRSSADPRLVVRTHERNRGKGAAIRTAVMHSAGETIVFSDADLSTPLDELPRFLMEIDAGADMVLGNRRAPGANITRHQPWLRESLGKGFTALARLLVAPGISDFTCGFKAFRREPALRIFQRSSIDGWAFDAELIAIAREQGRRIVQVPVRWHHEDDTKVRLSRAVASSLRDLLVIASRRLSGRYR